MASSSVSFNPASPILREKYAHKLEKSQKEANNYKQTASRLAQIIPTDLATALQFQQEIERCNAIYQKLHARLIKLNTPQEKPEITARLQVLNQLHDKVKSTLKDRISSSKSFVLNELTECQRRFENYKQALPQLALFVEPKVHPQTAYEQALSELHQSTRIYRDLRSRLEQLPKTPSIVQKITALNEIQTKVCNKFYELIGLNIHLSYARTSALELCQINHEWLEFCERALPIRLSQQETVSDKNDQCKTFASSLTARLNAIMERHRHLLILDPIYSRHCVDFQTVSVSLASLESRALELSFLIQEFAEKSYPLELVTKDPFSPIAIPPRTLSEIRSWPSEEPSSSHFASVVIEKFPFMQETSTDGDSFFSAFIASYLMHPDHRDKLLDKIERASMRSHVMNQVEHLISDVKHHGAALVPTLNKENNLLLAIHYFRNQTSHYLSAYKRLFDKDPNDPLIPGQAASLGICASQREIKAAALAFKTKIEIYDLDLAKVQSFNSSLKTGKTLYLAKRGSRYFSLFPSLITT